MDDLGMKMKRFRFAESRKKDSLSLGLADSLTVANEIKSYYKGCPCKNEIK